MSVKKTGRAYPFPGQTKGWPKTGLFHRLTAMVETAKILRRRKKRADRVEIALHSPATFRPLKATDLPLVFLAHNDLKLAYALLTHYRRLGVTRFICVDDCSTDGCREFLAGEADVDVWTSPVRYREARRGKLWREALFARYGKNRWYLNVDADEFLVYEDCFARPLPELIKKLERLGERRLAAPMLDFYPNGELSGAVYDGKDGRMPWEMVRHFDTSGYQLTFTKRYMSLCGGPRTRKLNAEVELMKYPLLYWDDRCSFGVSIHQPTPFEWNFSPISGVLLHFKFFADVQEKMAHAVADQQYFDGAREYRKILEALEKDGALDFTNESSVAYQEVGQLIELGFFRRLWDDGV